MPTASLNYTSLCGTTLESKVLLFVAFRCPTGCVTRMITEVVEAEKNSRQSIMVHDPAQSILQLSSYVRNIILRYFYFLMCVSPPPLQVYFVNKLRNRVYKCGLGSTDPGQGRMVGFCEQSNGSGKDGKFLDRETDYQLLKIHSAS